MILYYPDTSFTFYHKIGYILRIISDNLTTASYPTVTSNMLEPTDEETAMSPNPFRATITLVIKSGIEVPAAKNVSPIT